MKIFLSIILVFVSVHMLDAYGLFSDRKDVTDKNRIRFPIVVDKKWGFIDRTGKVIIPPKYISVDHFSETLALVRTDQGFGFIDIHGNEVISPRFQVAKSFSNGLAAVKIKEKLSCSDITIKGKRMIVPDKIKTGFIDRKGKLLVPYKNYEANRFNNNVAIFNISRFSTYFRRECFPYRCSSYKTNGPEMVLCDSENNMGLFGLMNKKGNILVKAEYIRADYRAGIVYFKKDNITRYYHTVKKKFLNVPSGKYLRFYEGLAVFTRDGKSGYIDTNGKEVIKNIYQGASEFSEGLACVFFGQRRGYGFINKKGVLVISPRRFDRCGTFHEGLCAVSAMEKWGFIDRKGKWIILPRYKKCYPFSNGIAMVLPDDTYFNIDKKYVYINRSGEVIWKSKERTE